MNIPDAAVEAAARAQFEWSGDESWDDYTDHDHDMRSKWRHETRVGLRAAAPYIAAAALRDAADEDFTTATPLRRIGYLRLRDRADRLEARQ